MNLQLIIKNIQTLSNVCPLQKIQLYGQEVVIIVKPNVLYNILMFFKYHLTFQFNILTSITGVDYPNNTHRFNLAYDLLSVRYNTRLRIKTFTHELFGIDSCNQLFFAASWYECEI